jgi:hypothetical protein
MLAKSRNILFLAVAFSHKLDAIVVACAIANLTLDPDRWRRIRRGEFYGHLIAGIQFGSREHTHPAVAERECPPRDNRSLRYIAHNYPDRDVDFISPPTARVGGLNRVWDCVSQGLPSNHPIGNIGLGFNSWIFRKTNWLQAERQLPVQ